jgi:hypothetical protein
MQVLLLLLKQFKQFIDTASNVGTDLFLRKSGGSDVIIAHNELNKETEI